MIRLALVLGLLAALFAGGVIAEEEVVRVPELQLPTIAGEAAATWDFHGKPLLLVEFASW